MTRLGGRAGPNTVEPPAAAAVTRLGGRNYPNTVEPLGGPRQ